MITVILKMLVIPLRAGYPDTLPYPPPSGYPRKLPSYSFHMQCLKW